jgi:hypothetical protein
VAVALGVAVGVALAIGGVVALGVGLTVGWTAHAARTHAATTAKPRSRKRGRASIFTFVEAADSTRSHPYTKVDSKWSMRPHRQVRHHRHDRSVMTRQNGHQTIDFTDGHFDGS